MRSPGIAVSSTGRMFSNYPSGLDPNNTNNGSNGKYAVAQLMGNSTEKAYPSVEINNPPGGAINYTTTPPSMCLVPLHLTSKLITIRHFQAAQTIRTTSLASK